MRWLSQREHSRAELAQKLKSKGFDETAIADALLGLEDDGLQSDQRFLDIFVRSQFAKGHGPQHIRQALRLKGLAGEGLEEALTAFDWDAALAQVYDKKFAGSVPTNAKEYAARFRFLSQRGFAQDEIQALLRRLRRGDD